MKASKIIYVNGLKQHLLIVIHMCNQVYDVAFHSKLQDKEGKHREGCWKGSKNSKKCIHTQLGK